jgi:hypothetical protein
MASGPRQFWDNLEERKFQFLLLALVGFTLLNIFLAGGPLRRVLAAVAVLGLLITTVRAAVPHRTPRILLFSAGLGMIALNIAGNWAPSRGLNMGAALLDSMFFGVIAFLIIGEVLRADTVTTDKLFGAVCAYLLIGATWAGAYAFVDVLEPGSFGFPGTGVSETLNAEQFTSGNFYTYFSYVTLTTLGYGDIRPIGHAARTLAWLEAAFGQIFLTVLVARLVSLQIAHASSSPGRRKSGDPGADG